MYQNCCKKCGSVSLYTESKCNNIGLYCSDCGAWIKWLGKDEARAFKHSQAPTPIDWSSVVPLPPVTEQCLNTIEDKSCTLKNNEIRLLKIFCNYLEEISDYLDEYDELIGLAFNEDEPIESNRRLLHFLHKRYSELVKN